MIIDLQSLPKEILKKIPLSIRNKVTSIDINELPIEVGYLVKNYKENKPSNSEIFNTAYDIIPEISIYNDFKQLVTKTATAIEYIKNYFAIRRGTYPFDPTFGNEFYKYLQMLDKSATALFIQNEFSELQNMIQNLFKIPIVIVSSDISNLDGGGFTDYVLNVSIKIDTDTTISVSSY